MNGGSGGVVVLIIIGIVLNMVIKAMRAKPKPPAQRQQAPRPTLGQGVERPLDERSRADLGQDVDRPFADQSRPEVPRTPIAPQTAPRVGSVRPAAEGRDPTQGVSLEGTSLEGPSLEGISLESTTGTDTLTGVRSPVMAGKKTASNPIAAWFRDGGVVRGIVMSEILNPPVSRRK